MPASGSVESLAQWLQRQDPGACIQVTARPLVAVLTPVHNGDAYLVQCIESVLAQTYDAWEYVLVDNASTDRTGDILRTYAARDRRIRIHTNDRLVPVIENHNVATRQLSPAARWCKFLCADDLLFPECLERMVALGRPIRPSGSSAPISSGGRPSRSAGYLPRTSSARGGPSRGRVSSVSCQCSAGRRRT
jgi:glycosyltransferase involved in cell wall biosynthesis